MKTPGPAVLDGECPRAARLRGGWPLLGVTMLMVLSIGCAPAAAPRVEVDNGTDVAIAFYVNGALAATLDPGTQSREVLAGRGAPPYAMEARTPAGTTIATFAISAQDYEAIASGGQGSAATMTFACGTIRFVLGTPPATPLPDDAETSPGACP